MADPRFSRVEAGQNFRPDRSIGITPTASAPGLTVVPGVLPEQISLTDRATSALGTFMPTLEKYADKQEKEYTEAELLAGREAALSEAKEYGEAVRSGKLAPNQSKWFMKGYKAQYGENIGTEWATEAKTAWMQSPEKNSDDPTAAATFIRDFTANKLKTVAGLDPDVRAGLVPKMSAMHGAVMSAQAEYSAQQVYSKNLELFGTGITNDIQEYIAAGGKMTTEALFAKIRTRDAGGRLQGVNNDDLNKTIAEAIAQKAREHGSLSLLKVGQQYDKIGNNPKYLGIFRGAEDAITNKALAQETRALAVEARNVRVMGQRALMNVFDGLLNQREKGEAPTLTNEMIKGLRLSGNPEAGMAALKLMQDQRQEFDKASPAEIAAIYNRLHQAGPDGAFAEADLLVTEKTVRSPEAARMAYTLAKEFADNRITESKPYTEGTSRLQGLGRLDIMGTATINPNAVNEAVESFQRDFVIWRSQNPKATTQEVDKMKNQLIDEYSQKIDQYKMMSGDGSDFKRGAIRGQPSAAPAPRPAAPASAPNTSPRITPPRPSQATTPQPGALSPEQEQRRQELLRKQQGN